jgi:hypothetical protein
MRIFPLNTKSLKIIHNWFIYWESRQLNQTIHLKCKDITCKPKNKTPGLQLGDMT